MVDGAGALAAVRANGRNADGGRISDFWDIVQSHQQSGEERSPFIDLWNENRGFGHGTAPDQDEKTETHPLKKVQSIVPDPKLVPALQAADSSTLNCTEKSHGADSRANGDCTGDMKLNFECRLEDRAMDRALDGAEQRGPTRSDDKGDKAFTRLIHEVNGLRNCEALAVAEKELHEVFGHRLRVKVSRRPEQRTETSHSRTTY